MEIIDNINFGKEEELASPKDQITQLADYFIDAVVNETNEPHVVDYEKILLLMKSLDIAINIMIKGNSRGQ